MADRCVARVEIDGTARSRFASGVNSVFTDDKKTCCAGSVTLRGNACTTGSSSVFVEGKPIARAGDLVVREGPILDGCITVFAG